VILTVTTVTNFCFTYPNSDGLYSPTLNSRKVGKWLKTLEKGRFSKIFENGENLSPLILVPNPTVRQTQTRALTIRISTSEQGGARGRAKGTRNLKLKAK
jgi:hypothetical protein